MKNGAPKKDELFFLSMCMLILVHIYIAGKRGPVEVFFKSNVVNLGNKQNKEIIPFILTMSQLTKLTDVLTY